MRRKLGILATALLVAVAFAGPGRQVIPGEPAGPLPKPDLSTPVEVSTDGIDAGYILQPIVADGNGTMYGPTGYGSYSMGFKFTPLLSGMISAIGRYRGSYNEASTVKLWDAADGSQLASASVTGTNWSYVSITPVFVEAGHEYFITSYGGSYVYYYYQYTIPVEKNDIRVINGAYFYGDGMPNNNGANYFYACPDFYFEPVPSTETWTGTVSTDWNVGGNWDGGYAPAAGINVVIPGGCPRYPTTNSGAGYGAKTLTIGAGGSVSTVSGKALTVTENATINGTLTLDGNATFQKGLTVNDGGTLTLQAGRTLTVHGDFENGGAVTNGGEMNCHQNFISYGSFTSGTFSEFRFVGHADATFSAGALDGSGFYNLSFNKTGLDAVVGGDPNGGYNWYFGPADMTIIANGPSQVAGDVTRWACFNMWGGGYTIKAKIFRANYNGYQWGMVTQGSAQSCEYGYNEYTETLSGVEVGDRIAAYEGGLIPFLGEGGMLIAYGDINTGYNGWYDWGYGPYALAGYISQPAGDVAASGSVAIMGDLAIAADNEVNVSSGTWTVSGVWTNNGEFNPGTGTVIFDGSSNISGTGDHDFHNLTITGELFAPSALHVSGTWNNTGMFDHGSGSVFFRGGQLNGGGANGKFRNLTIENLTDGNVVLGSDLNVETNLTIDAGTLLVGAHTLTLGRSNAPGTVSVASGAGISVLGTTNTARGTVTAVAEAYPFNFTVNGSIAAMFANFTWIGPNGIDVRSGGMIDAVNNFSRCTFTAGSSAGAMLKIANSQVIDDIVRADFYAAEGCNIDYPGTGHITVTDGTGNRWGEDFDNDPSNLVEWKVDVPPYDPGWVEMAHAPGLVKDGGWLAYNEGNGLIYGGRGYKSLDFWSYDMPSNTWATLPAVPAGAKPCNKGTQATTDGSNYVYLAKGNNTFEFYRYDITAGSGWEQLADVPPGTSGKKVKVSDLTYSDGYVYMVKGNKSDFMRFNTATLAWEPLPDAPAGAKAKWDKGSFVVTDDEGMVIYAHKARYMELWPFNVATQTWGTAALPGMPLIGMMGKNKKAKDGSGGAFYDGAIHALKGGNTQEFWKYDVAANAWTEYDTIPAVGSTGKKKRVKNGGDVTSLGDGAFFAFKGNKTNEFWRYVKPVTPAAKPLPTGVMAGETPAAQPFVKIGPNPLANGLATLRYALPAAGPASINVYDVSGRTVLSRSLVATRSGAVSLDLRSLSAGIYLVKVEAAGFTGTQKLVIQQ
jgi:hypothetical protein